MKAVQDQWLGELAVLFTGIEEFGIFISHVKAVAWNTEDSILLG
jgi:hypothetical protein